MNRSLRTLTVLAVAGAGLLVLPSAVSSWARPQEPAADHEKESPLEEQMEKLDRGMKSLRRSVADPAKAADNIVLVRGMKDAAVAGLPLCPEPFKPMSDTEKVLWRIGFERKLLQTADGLLVLEQALVEGRFEDAKKQHEALMGMKKEAHNAYVPPEEEE
jgi:hypothetical protein